jgi:hypothetical protein
MFVAFEAFWDTKKTPISSSIPELIHVDLYLSLFVQESRNSAAALTGLLCYQTIGYYRRISPLQVVFSFTRATPSQPSAPSLPSSGPPPGAPKAKLRKGLL